MRYEKVCDYFGIYNNYNNPFGGVISICGFDRVMQIITNQFIITKTKTLWKS